MYERVQNANFSANVTDVTFVPWNFFLCHKAKKCSCDECDVCAVCTVTMEHEKGNGNVGAVFLRSDTLTRFHWFCIKKEENFKNFYINFACHMKQFFTIQTLKNFQKFLHQFYMPSKTTFPNILLKTLKTSFYFKKRFQQKKTTGEKRDENQQVF